MTALRHHELDSRKRVFHGSFGQRATAAQRIEDPAFVITDLFLLGAFHFCQNGSRSVHWEM